MRFTCLSQVSLLALILALLPSPRALAWIETGHREIALIAWDDLTPATKTKVTEILKAHPLYGRDLLANLPQGSSDEDTSRYAFSSASTWPDTVKLISDPMHATHDHPAWHYIDIPFVLDNQPLPPDKKPRGKDATGPQNILEALTKNTSDLKDPAIAAQEKAVALCWVIHLCGDVHQPLHAAVLISKQFPDGDRGGNSFMVLREPPYTNSESNLHFIWDTLPGDFQSDEFDGYLAHGLKADPQFSREKLKDALAIKDFSAWADESHALAVKYAYLNGDLTGAIRRFGRQPTDPGATTQRAADTTVPGVPPGYIAQAEHVAARQVVLAGYRTADLLNSIFDPKPPAADAH